MVTADFAKQALELPPEERLELARRLVESVVDPLPLEDGLIKGIRRVEDIVTGRVKPLTEGEYRAAMK